MWSFVESNKSFYWFQMYGECLLQSRLPEILKALFGKRLSRVSTLKWSLKHLDVCFKQSDEVLKPLAETRSAVECFESLAGVFLSGFSFKNIQNSQNNT